MKTKTIYKTGMILFIILMGFPRIYATKYSIDVRDFEFSPANLTGVKIGDTIHWEWKNGSHTTTSTTIPAGAAAWDKVIDASHLTYDYIPTVNGVYNYKCTPHASMGMVGSFTVVSVSGISESERISNISIFPNPVRDNVNFNCKLPDGVFIHSLNVYDANGKLLREFSLGNRISFPAYINLAGLPSGIMVFEFRDNFNRTYTVRAVRKN